MKKAVGSIFVFAISVSVGFGVDDEAGWLLKESADVSMSGEVDQPTCDLAQKQQFLALGEVGQVGFHPWREDLTVESAIVVAGGYTAKAALNSLRILRPEEGGGHAAIEVDLEWATNGDPAQNRVIRPGDILFVPALEAGPPGSAGDDFLQSADKTKKLPVSESYFRALVVQFEHLSEDIEMAKDNLERAPEEYTPVLRAELQRIKRLHELIGRRLQEIEVTGE